MKQTMIRLSGETGVHIFSPLNYRQIISDNLKLTEKFDSWGTLMVTEEIFHMVSDSDLTALNGLVHSESMLLVIL